MCVVQAYMNQCDGICMNVHTGTILVLFCCCDKHHNQEPLRGGEGVFGLHFLITILHRGKSGQELKEELEAETIRESSC